MHIRGQLQDGDTPPPRGTQQAATGVLPRGPKRQGGRTGAGDSSRMAGSRDSLESWSGGRLCVSSEVKENQGTERDSLVIHLLTQFTFEYTNVRFFWNKPLHVHVPDKGQGCRARVMSGFIFGDKKESSFSESKEGRQAVAPGKPSSVGWGRGAAVPALEPTDFQGEAIHVRRQQRAG